MTDATRRKAEVRPWVVFKADFPDDQLEDDRDIVRFGGHNAAEAVGGKLQELGLDVEQPRYAGEQGWDFAAQLGRRRFWCQVTSFCPTFFLLFDDDPRMPSVAEHGRLAEELTIALRSDGRFRDILWYTRKHGPVEVPDGSGTESPLAEESPETATRRAFREPSPYWHVLLGFVLAGTAGVLAICGLLSLVPDRLMR